MPSRNRKWIWGAVALACGLLASAGYLGAAPAGSWLLAAGRGLGEGGSGWADQALAFVWRSSGASGLSWLRWAAEFAGWSLGAGIVLWLAGRFGRAATGIAAVACLGLAGWKLAEGVMAWGDRRLDARLCLPIDLFDALPRPHGEIYVNPSALAAARLVSEAGLPPIEAALTCADPSRWRAAMREHGWTTAVLAGPVAEFQPLLDHLLASPDWRIAKVANSGWVFRRGGAPAPPPPDPDEIKLATPAETAIYLCQLGERLDAMRETRLARRAFSRAVELAPKHPLVRLLAARRAAMRGDWSDAAKHAAAARDAGAPGANAILARCLFEKGEVDKARRAAARATREHPDDPETWFLEARIARADNDFAAEANALESAVAAARRSGLPVGGYLSYLGQARAREGDAKRAAAAYREALASGDLPPPQSSAVREALDIIEQRAP